MLPLLTITQDSNLLTTIKRTNMPLKRIENAFEVAEHTDAMLAFWDKDLICRFANASYLRWFGMSPSDMIDKITLPQLLGPLFQQNLPFVQRALQGKRQIFERDITLPNGETKNTIATYTPEIRLGAVVGFYAHVADVSLIKNKSVEILETVEEYAVLATTNNYLNGVEHTLRSSLFTKFPGLKSLANQYYVSMTKLKKGFKTRYGCTIFSYYRSLQMQVAEKYIHGKIYSKTELADMFKFDNPSNFTNCFKKYILLKPHSDENNIAKQDSKKLYHTSSTSSCMKNIPTRQSEFLQESTQYLKSQLAVWEKGTEPLLIGTWERNFETKVATWNSMTRKILELPPDFEPDLSPSLNFYKPGADRNRAKKNLDRAFLTGKSFDFEAKITTAEGNEKKVRVVGYAEIRNNCRKRMYGIFQELT